MARMVDCETLDAIHAEELKKRPYMDHGLGDLLDAMNKLRDKDPNVLKPEDEVPEESKDNQAEYKEIIAELNRKEEEYTHVPLSRSRFG